MKCKLVTLLLLLCMNPLLSDSGKKLTFDQVYNRAQPRILSSLPSIKGWWDSDHYLELRDRNYLIKVEAQSGDTAVVLDYKSLDSLLSKDFSIRRPLDHTSDYNNFLLRKEGNLYHFHLPSQQLKQLTGNALEEKNPLFSPNVRYIAYTRGHNLFVQNLETGLEKQLTDDGNNVIYNGWASWVYYEEILGRRSRYKAFWWSPNSKMIAFLRFDDSDIPRFPLYNADGQHGTLEWMHYPKAGDPLPDVKLGIVHIETGKRVWVDIDDRTGNYVAWPKWFPNSETLIYQWMNRDQDCIKLFYADAVSGESQWVYTEKQDSWVTFFENLHVLKDNRSFLFLSDKDGWSHLYSCLIEKNKVKQLTRGDWNVQSIERIDERNKKIYFHANKVSTESQLFCVDFSGKNLKQLTQKPGTHRCQVSPEGQYYIDAFENLDQPAEMHLFTTSGESVRRLGDRRTPELQAYDLGKPELFAIPSEDGYDLPAVWLLPPDFDKSKKYPVLFSIYGGPGSKTVSNRFQRLSFSYLAQNQIIPISVDHRGSGHFGKKGKAEMHRNLGKWEMHDLITAVKWLKQQSFIDSSKIAITGGSYGGYVTCLALTYGADYFTHGIALFSVTDWHLYDNVYTERYMDRPGQNPDGYEFGSVMTHVEKYNGGLFITHGTLDDNVHMQNSIQLIDALQDLNKDFDLMLYPNERHGLWLPKRKHLTREMMQFWFKNLLEKPFEPEKE